MDAFNILDFESATARSARTTITVAAGATEEKVVTWGSAFLSTAYTVSVSLESSDGPLGSSLRMRRIVSRTPSQMTVAVTNDDGVNPLSGTLHAIAVGD